MHDLVSDLTSFIDRSPTPYHAVAEAVRRLGAAGFEQIEERDVWSVAPGERFMVVRNEGSLVAVEAGAISPAEAGFRMLGAHTDSPNLRLKPNPELEAHGYRQLAVEPYGGVLQHTWLDRDLSIAGRVSFREAGELRTELIDFDRPMVRVPSLAIHLHREVNREGLQLNAQKHLVPIIGLGSTRDLRGLLVNELATGSKVRTSQDELLGFDLMLYDVQPSGLAGSRGEFIFAPRLDNLASCHAALSALITARRDPSPHFTRVVVLYDHEEVGSRSAEGAGGTFLLDVLARVVQGFKGSEPQGLARGLASSILISVDMAHAVHPNYADKHDGEHRPVVGKGPVIKTNSNQAYSSDAVTTARFTAICSDEGIEPQHFVSRSDMPCGSTIGPITAARVGVRTVDVGNPMLSMHSCREMAGSADVDPMVRVLGAYLNGA
ncbi:MAG: M18 family aminopeptidase [Myxococcota bacterium]